MTAFLSEGEKRAIFRLRRGTVLIAIFYDTENPSKLANFCSRGGTHEKYRAANLPLLHSLLRREQENQDLTRALWFGEARGPPESPFFRPDYLSET
jgi:hypothetical protein